MHPNDLKDKDYFSITEVNYLLNSTLEKTFPKIRFEGEIGELTVAKSGHLYFTLKDPSAQLSAVMWKASVMSLRFKPSVGAKVLCEGRPNVYSQNGRLQIIVQSMQPSGEGALLLKLQALYAKLEKEGLFEESRKRPIPRFPTNVGIVTSGSGAVIHDITVRIKARMPSIQLYLVDTRVQGEGAAKEIANAIRFLNNFEPEPQKKLDVIIVGRGGGSLEDLWAFNEEEVVRAIFASSIPIISSVGHEVDHCLSDLVADARAATPTAAAEMISMVKEELIERVESLFNRLSSFERWLRPLEQRLDDFELRLNQVIRQILLRAKVFIDAAASKVMLMHPSERIKFFLQKIDHLEGRIRQSAHVRIVSEQRKVDSLHRALQSLNPKSVLQRGYALVEFNGKVVTDSQDLSIGDNLYLSLAKGSIAAVVKEKGK